MHAFRTCSLLAVLLLASASALSGSLTVAVAANVQYAFGEVQAAFQKQSGHEIRPVYNSSGKFAAQIMHGAPFDVFLSADMDYPQQLHSAGHAAAPAIYAYGALVLWTMKDLDLGNWQEQLASRQVKTIAIANSKVAPYGRETMKALAHFNLDAALKPKLVFGESVSQTNQYIHSGSADAGFTAKSVVMSPQMRGQGKWRELPAESYRPIPQGIVVLRHGQQNNPELAQQFRDFVLSSEARVIFARYGYLLP